MSLTDTEPEDKEEDLVNDEDELESEDVKEEDICDGAEEDRADVDGAEVDAGIGGGAASPTSSECPLAFTRHTKLHPSRIDQSLI